PERRAAAIRGTYRLKNLTDRPIDRVDLTLARAVKVVSLELPTGRIETDDRDHGYSVRRLGQPVPPGGETELSFDLAVENPGFVTHDPTTKLVGNGTFSDSYDYSPHLGYLRALELDDPNQRRRQGLPPVVRQPPLDDPRARRNTYISSE